MLGEKKESERRRPSADANRKGGRRTGGALSVERLHDYQHYGLSVTSTRDAVMRVIS